MRKKELVMGGLTLALMLKTAGPVTAKSDYSRYKDVSPDSWYAESVNRMDSLGGIEGYLDGTFRPQKNMTIAEFLKVCITTLTKEQCPSIGNHWGDGFHARAVQLGIISAEDFSCEPKVLNRHITREEMATVLIGINTQIQKEPLLPEEGLEQSIKDFSSISENRKVPVKQAYAKGLMTGKPGGFDPKGKSTRAEVTEVLVRLLDKEKRKIPETN